MSMLFPKLEPLPPEPPLLRLQLLRAELDKQGARTPSGVHKTQASPAPRSASPLVQQHSLKSMWDPTSSLCVLLQVLEAKPSTCFSHLRGFEIKGLFWEWPQESSTRPQKVYIQRSLLPWVSVTCRNWLDPYLPSSASVMADQWTGISHSESVFSTDTA